MFIQKHPDIQKLSLYKIIRTHKNKANTKKRTHTKKIYTKTSGQTKTFQMRQHLLGERLIPL